MIRIGRRLLSMPVRFLARFHRTRGRLGKAETLLKAICALDPAHAGIALNLARIRIRRERKAEAMQGLADALNPTGFAPEILIELARLQIEAGELVAAGKNLRKASERDGTQAAISFLSARIEELKGDDDRALELARQGLRAHPDDLALHVISWRCASRSVSQDAAAEMCEAFAAIPDRSVSYILEAARFLRGIERWDRSLAILERAAKPESANPEVARERAECLIGKNELDEASRLLLEILDDSPGDRDASLVLARCEIGLGKPAKALERLDRLEASAGSDPTSVELKVECRLRLADMGVDAEMHVREALSDVREAGANFPVHPNLIAIEIKILRMTGRLEEARRLAERVPETARRGPAIGALFDVFMDGGRLDLAEALLSGLPDELSDADWAKRMRARVLKEQGRLEDAESLLETACAHDPSLIPIILDLAQIRTMRGKISEAKRGLSESLLPAGFAPAILIELARLQIESREFEPAEVNLKKAAEGDGPAGDIGFLAARIEEMKGDHDRALELARERLREDPDHIALQALSWRCAERSVSPDEAATMCEAFAAMPDRSVSDMLEAARFLRGMERWDRSLAILERAAKMESANPEAARERAECLIGKAKRLIGKNEHDEACRLLLEILEDSPGDRNASLVLARCEIGLGKPAKALERLDRLEASAGSDPASVELKVECRLRLADMGVDAEMHVREALSDVREAGANFPFHPNLIAIEIKILRMTGRLEEARRLAEQVPETARKGPAIGALFEVFMDCGRLDLAEDLLSGLPDEHREVGWAIRYRARVLNEQGRLEEAESLLEAASAHDPSQVPIILDLARIRTKRGNISEAKQGLSTSLLPAGFAPAILVELARLQIESREFEPAGVNLKKAAEGDGPAGDIAFLAARIEEMKGDHDRALALARERLREDPDDIALQALSWRCAERCVSADEAATMCEAFAARPDCPVEGILVAVRYMRGRERWDRGLAILEAAAFESVGFEVTRERVECLIGMNEFDEATRLLEEILEVSPGDRGAGLALARCEIELEEPEKALERLERLEANVGCDLMSVELKVECRLRLADADSVVETHVRAALSDIREASANYPDHPNLIALEIKILRMTGRLEKARRLAERVPETARRGPAIGALFDVFMDCGRLEQADALLSGLPDEHRDAGWAMQLRARVLKERGRLEEAESLLEAVCAREPSLVPIILDLARIRTMRGKIAEAKLGLAKSLLPVGFAPAILIELARLQVESGEFQPAKVNLKKAAEDGGPAGDIAFLAAKIEELKGDHDRALVLARERLREYPDDIALQALSWRCAERCVSPDEAEEMCESFVARPDCSAEGLLEAARYLRSRERWDRSLAILDAAALACAGPRVARERAECLIGKNELKLASGLLEEIIGNSPGDRGVELTLARCEAGLGNTVKALDLVERLEAVAGSDLATIELKAECRMRMADIGVEPESHLREALSDIEKGYSEFPDHPTLVALEIRALRKAGRVDDALSRAEGLPETSIRGPAAVALFELYLDSHLTDQAEAVLSGPPEGCLGTIGARQFRARLLSARNRDADAEALLEETLAEDSGHVPAILEMARIRAKSGNASMARQRLADALPATGYPHALLFELTGMLVAEGDYEPALELLRKAAEREGAHPAEMRIQAARIEELRGNADRALEMARKGLREHPEDIRFEALTWRCALAAGSRDEAAALCQAYAANPERPKGGLILAARFLKEMERWDAGLAILDRAAELNPESPIVANERAKCFIGRNDALNASLALKEIVGNEPENLWAAIALARCEVELGEVRSALDRLESLNANAVTEAEVYELKAECHLRLANMPDQRDERVEKALSIIGEGYYAHPHHPNLIAVEIRALRVAGRNEEALWRADMIPETSHTGPAIRAIFELYLESGKLEEADAFLSNFPESIRQTSWVALFRARLLAQQGRAGEAETLLEKSLADFPEHAPTLIELARLQAEG